MIIGTSTQAHMHAHAHNGLQNNVVYVSSPYLNIRCIMYVIIDVWVHDNYIIRVQLHLLIPFLTHECKQTKRAFQFGIIDISRWKSEININFGLNKKISLLQQGITKWTRFKWKILYIYLTTYSIYVNLYGNELWVVNF